MKIKARNMWGMARREGNRWYMMGFVEHTRAEVIKASTEGYLCTNRPDLPLNIDPALVARTWEDLRKTGDYLPVRVRLAPDK